MPPNVCTNCPPPKPDTNIVWTIDWLHWPEQTNAIGYKVLGTDNLAKPITNLIDTVTGTNSYLEGTNRVYLFRVEVITN